VTVALTRFKVVSSIEEQMRRGVGLATALRDAALCPWPDESGRCYAVRTLEDWWYNYQREGFGGLAVNRRSDRGTSRAIDGEMGRWLIEQVIANPKIPFKVLYAYWQREGRELPPLRSAYRYLARHGHDRKSLQAGRLETGPKKAFECAFVNDLWMVDFSPGPTIRTADGKVHRPQLCVLIDDTSRIIPFAGYYPNANTAAFLDTLREGVQRRGVPVKLYTDQGKPFVNQHAKVVCANLGIRLLHAKPYHAWSKGKVERVIQTIQNGFESTLSIMGNKVSSIEELNKKFSFWVQATYHQRVHESTRMSPESRYLQQLDRIRRVDVSGIDLDTLFYTRVERTVRKDGTVRIDKRLYEVPLSLRALRVELRFDPFKLDRIEVWYRESLAGMAKPVNLHLNSETGGSASYETDRR